MKKLFLISLFITVTVFSQTECNNNVSTDNTAPTNDALPSNPDAARYLNGFDWFPVDDLGYYAQYDLTEMYFAGVPLETMVNIMNLSMVEYDYITDGPLPVHVNGWELLMINLGRYPDDVTPVPYDDNDAMPYIVLYNRYSGTIRVFVNFGLDHTVGSGANAMEISLWYEYDDKMSGILRLNQGIDQALNETSNVEKLTSIAIAPATANQWASTDFQIAYDPCTCYYPSELRLDFTQISESTLEIHGRSVSLVDESLISNDLQVENPEEFLTGFDYTGDDAVGGGIVMHKTMLKMMEDYVKKYKRYNDEKVAIGEHNKQVKTNLAILKMGKAVISFITLGIGGDIIPEGLYQTELAAELAAADALGLTEDEINAAYGELGAFDTDWFKVVENLQNGIVKADSAGNKLIDNDELFKYVEQIFGTYGKTFIATNFKAKSLPKAPAIPKATFTEMHFSGKIEDFLPIGGISFYTPGTYGSEGTGSPPLTRVDEYPIYNEVLGHFALLKSPKIKISKTIPDDQEHYLYNHGYVYGAFFNIQMKRYQTWTNEYQIQLAEKLEFAINDVPGVANYTIEAAFNIIATPSGLGKPDHTIMNAFHDSVTCVNIKSTNTTINIDSGYTDIITSKKKYHSQASNNLIGHIHIPYDDDTLISHYRSKVEIQTPFLPIDAFFPFVAGMGIRNEYVDNKTHTFPATSLSYYPLESGEILVTTDEEDSTYVFDLTNPYIDKPDSANPNIHGYGYTFKVELKLNVDIEFETLDLDGNPNSLSMVLTYPIHNEDINYLTNDIVNDLTNTDKNIGKYMKSRYFEDIDFHGQKVLGCDLAGMNYTCAVLDKITIDGIVTTSGGYTVDMIAGNLIEVVYESQVSPEIVLQIDTILDYSHPMPKANQDDVRIFCQGATGTPPDYLANTATRAPNKIKEEEEEEIEDANITKEKFSFYLYPNPAQTEAFIEVSDADYEITVNITDITGKQVALEVIKDGKGIYKLNISNFAQGIYLITVSSNGLSSTKRLMIH